MVAEGYHQLTGRVICNTTFLKETLHAGSKHFIPLPKGHGDGGGGQVFLTFLISDSLFEHFPPDCPDTIVLIREEKSWQNCDMIVWVFSFSYNPPPHNTVSWIISVCLGFSSLLKGNPADIIQGWKGFSNSFSGKRKKYPIFLFTDDILLKSS